MPSADRPTWSSSDRRVPRYIVQPVNRFLHVEASGGILLLVATIVALVWANSPWSASYDQLWHTTVALEAGPLHLSEDLGHWVNDGLMAIFFFVVGLEIKSELVVGQLSKPRDAALPAIGSARRHDRPRRSLPRRQHRRRWARMAGASRWPPTSPSRSGS